MDVTLNLEVDWWQVGGFKRQHIQVSDGRHSEVVPCDCLVCAIVVCGLIDSFDLMEVECQVWGFATCGFATSKSAHDRDLLGARHECRVVVDMSVDHVIDRSYLTFPSVEELDVIVPRIGQSAAAKEYDCFRVGDECCREVRTPVHEFRCYEAPFAPHDIEELHADYGIGNGTTAHDHDRHETLDEHSLVL